MQSLGEDDCWVLVMVGGWPLGTRATGWPLTDMQAASLNPQSTTSRQVRPPSHSAIGQTHYHKLASWGRWVAASRWTHLDQTFESHRTYNRPGFLLIRHSAAHYQPIAQLYTSNSYYHLNQMAPTLLRSAAASKASTVSVRALLRSSVKPAVKPVGTKTVKKTVSSKTVSSKVPAVAPKPGQLQLGFTKVSSGGARCEVMSWAQKVSASQAHVPGSFMQRAACVDLPPQPLVLRLRSSKSMPLTLLPLPVLPPCRTTSCLLAALPCLAGPLVCWERSSLGVDSCLSWGTR
jgi:hypothetical protein